MRATRAALRPALAAASGFTGKRLHLVHFGGPPTPGWITALVATSPPPCIGRDLRRGRQGRRTSAGTYALVGSTPTFHFGTMAGGNSATASLVLRPAASSGNANYPLTASLVLDQQDSAPANNSAGVSVLVLGDSDGDGIPDQFETAHGLNPTDPAAAARDADGDGQSNLAQFLAGTDLGNAASTLRVTNVARNAASGTVSVTFNSVAGTLCSVE